jgi:hypothetical protein
MTTVVTPPLTDTPAARRGASIATRASALLLFLMFVAAEAPTLVTAWTSELDEGTHLIHDLSHATHTVVMFGPALVAILLGRYRPAAIATLWAALLLPLPIALGWGLIPPAKATVPVLAVLIITVLDPGRAQLVRSFRPSRLLVVLAVLISIPLAMVVWDQVSLQAALPATEPHAALGHWVGMGFWSAAMICLVVLISLRPPGWRVPLYSGSTAAVIVAVGSIANPGMPSSFGRTGGTLVLAAAIGFAVAAELVDRRVGVAPASGGRP